MTVEPTIEVLIRKLVREELHAELAKKPPEKPPASYISIREYAKARSVCVSTVRNAIRDGRLPAMKIGTALRVQSDVEIGTSVIPTVLHPGPSPAQIADRVLARRVKSSRSITSGAYNDRRTARIFPSGRLAS